MAPSGLTPTGNGAAGVSVKAARPAPACGRVSASPTTGACGIVLASWIALRGGKVNCSMAWGGGLEGIVAARTNVAAPHLGHLIFLPANSGFSLSWALHA